jgi:hypothetical protein
MLMMMTELVSQYDHLGSLSHERLVGYLARARMPSRISSSMRQHDINCSRYNDFSSSIDNRK